MVVAGDLRGWDHKAIEFASVRPRPGRPAGSYECGHAAGVGVRLYAAVVVAWVVCGQVHDATDRSLVDARHGRPSGERRAREGSTMTSGLDVRRQAAGDGDKVWGGRVGRQAAVNEGKVWLGWSGQ